MAHNLLPFIIGRVPKRPHFYRIFVRAACQARATEPARVPAEIGRVDLSLIGDLAADLTRGGRVIIEVRHQNRILAP